MFQIISVLIWIFCEMLSRCAAFTKLAIGLQLFWIRPLRECHSIQEEFLDYHFYRY